jgi:WD40 repeat protein
MINLEEKWQCQIDEPILQIEIGDINNNGHKEIIAALKSGRLLILSLTGKVLADKKITKKSSIWKIEVRDIDDDNKSELILGGLDGLLRVFKCNSSYELETFWEHQFGASISGFLLSDINNDNLNEIIAYSIDKSLRVLNPLDGSLIWGQLFEDGIGDAIVWQDPLEPALKEVIAVGNDGTLRIFKGMNGDLLWFKRYTDKIRCVSLFNSNGKEFIVCGGDDKMLHFIEKSSYNEIKTIQCQEYVWKCSLFDSMKKSSLLISTYSFDFFDSLINIHELEFNSKLMCFNQDLDILWEINNVNVETVLHVILKGFNFFIIGTTKGRILLIEGNTGKILAEIKKKSCVNDAKFDLDLKTLITCHDDGSLFAYFLGEI